MKQELGHEAFIGLDTHKETIHATALDKNGESICSYEFPNYKDAIKEFIKGFKPWNTVIGIEACGIWRGCYKVLRDLGYKVKLANPLKCRQISKDKKTDKVDSKIIADLLRVGYLPEVYIPSDEILELRDLTRHKSNLVRLLTRIKNKIKMSLLRDGIPYEKKLWNKKGINWLRDLKDEKIDDFLDLYELFENKIKKNESKIRMTARMKEETRLLTTIPGIAEFGATLILAEIGDINRFPTKKHLHAYAGAVPGIYQSGTKTRTTKKKEVNHWLKGISGECAGRSTLKKNKLQKHYFRVRKNKGWKTARKSTARKLLSIVWHVLKEKEPYHES